MTTGELSVDISVDAWVAIGLTLIFLARYLAVSKPWTTLAGRSLIAVLFTLNVALLVPAIKYTWPAWAATHTMTFLWFNAVTRSTVLVSMGYLVVALERRHRQQQRRTQEGGTQLDKLRTKHDDERGDQQRREDERKDDER